MPFTYNINSQSHEEKHSGTSQNAQGPSIGLVKSVLSNNKQHEQDPELWMITRESWILKNRQDKLLVLNEGPVQVHSIHHEYDQDSLG
jgi:hypothetical protein